MGIRGIWVFFLLLGLMSLIFGKVAGIEEDIV
jgi:hypothetical protein